MSVKNIMTNSINQLVDGDGVSGSYLLENFNGILLTPEILEKCAFELHENKTEFPDIYFKRIGYNDWDQDFFFQLTCPGSSIDFCSIYSRDNPESSCQVLRYPQYLHQLQNLIYALTGEDLIITFLI